MGSLVSWVKYYGRGVDGLRALVFTAVLMILIWPYFLFSVSFQLSFLATLGLIVYGNKIVKTLNNIFKKDSFFIEDLGTTISAQVFVIPIVSYYFGRISIISFLVNPLVLWTVPVSTVLGTFYVLISCFSSFFARIMSIFIYPFLTIFVSLVYFFSSFSFSSADFSAGTYWIVIYYVFAILVGFLINRRKGKIYENK